MALLVPQKKVRRSHTSDILIQKRMGRIDAPLVIGLRCLFCAHDYLTLHKSLN